MKFEFYYESIDSFDFDKQQAKNHIRQLILNEQKIPGDICFIFCSDKYLLEINKEYLDHDYYTDIITFDYCKSDVISGDIFISIDRITDNAKVYNSGFYNELYRVIFHGILHLAGYNDKSKEEQKEMRGKENYYLNKFVN